MLRKLRLHARILLCILCFRAQKKNSLNTQKIGTVPVLIVNDRIVSDEVLGQFDVATSLNVVDEEAGYSIGIDADAVEKSYPAEQILLTGWLNTDEGSNFSGLYELDGTIYSAADIAELGGSVAWHLAPRNISDIDENLRGRRVYAQQRGFILEIDAPFLENGRHQLSVTFNLALPNQEAELIDLAPVEIIIDNSLAKKEEVEKIIRAWNPIETDADVTEE